MPQVTLTSHSDAQALSTEKEVPGTKRGAAVAARLVVVLSISLVAGLVVAQGTPVEASSRDTKTVTVNGRTCEVTSNWPHVSTSPGTAGKIKALAQYGNCTQPVTSITVRVEIQKCYHASFGCLWSPVGTTVNTNIPGQHTGLRNSPSAIANCAHGHYRTRSRITVHSGGRSGSSSWSTGPHPTTYPNGRALSC
jgi:hypothetical protein